MGTQGEFQDRLNQAVSKACVEAGIDPDKVPAGGITPSGFWSSVKLPALEVITMRADEQDDRYFYEYPEGSTVWETYASFFPEGTLRGLFPELRDKNKP